MAEEPKAERRTGSGISRRGFLAVGAAGVAGVSLGGCDAGASTEGVAGGQSAVATPAGVDDDAWAHVRARFILQPGTAYMNNASLGMPPASVAQAVAAGSEALSREPLHGKHDLGEIVASRVVPGLAALLGAGPDEVVLTRNASEALHMGAVGVRLKPGEEVLVTSQEHPAGRRPWDYRAARHGVQVNTVFIPSPFQSEAQVVGLVEQALTPATRAIAFCHVTRGGHLYPVRQLCAMARERGIVSHVDGAQAVGVENVAARTRHLSDYLKTRLAAMPGVTILSGPTPATSCPGSTIFELDGVDAIDAVSLMAERASIHIDEHQRDGHNAIRISTHVYNTTTEIDRLAEELQRLPA